MDYYSRYVIAATDITAQPKMFARYRGKPAKEIYRFAKGVAVSKSITGPAIFALGTIPGEMTKGVIYSAIGAVGETVIGYTSFIGISRWAYKATNVTFIKNSARLIYNFACLPLTIYSKGIAGFSDLIYLSKLEEYWFGGPVYIFDDNRLWIETNFTIDDAVKHIKFGEKN